MVTTKTFIGSTVTPPDGYVLTYDSVDGYYKPRPLPNPGQIMSIHSPGAGPYNVGIEDVTIIPSHTGTYTVNLPPIPQVGRTITIKDGYGDASINPISVAAVPFIDGSPTYSLNTNYGCVRVIFTGTTYMIISKF
jgi:hypothetical protein